MAGNSFTFKTKPEREAAKFLVAGITRAYAYIKGSLPKWRQEMREADWFESDIDYLQWQLDICDEPVIRAGFNKAIQSKDPAGNLDRLRSHYRRMVTDLELVLKAWERDPAKKPWHNKHPGAKPRFSTRPGFINKPTINR